MTKTLLANSDYQNSSVGNEMIECNPKLLKQKNSFDWHFVKWIKSVAIKKYEFEWKYLSIVGPFFVLSNCQDLEATKQNQ